MLEKFYLQLFASDADLADVQEDGPDFEDNEQGEDGGEEPEGDIGAILDMLKGSSKPDVKEDSEEEVDEGEEEEDTEIPIFDNREDFDSYIFEAVKERTAELEESVQTEAQKIANKYIGDRVKRDRKANEVKKLEALTGVPLEELSQSIFNNAVETKAENLGISIEEAEKIVSNEFRVRLDDLYNSIAKEEAQTKVQIDQYMRDKSDFLKANPKLAPLLQKYEQEIDDLSRGGQILDYDIAANQILGKKLTQGDLLKSVKEGAKRQASKKKTGATVPSPRRTSGKVQGGGGTLSNEQMQIAAALGVTRKEYLAELAKERKSRKQR